MASAVPQKRMVSSVFITLASPFRATVTPTVPVHSSPVRDPQPAITPLRSTSASSQDGSIMSPLYTRSRLPATLTQSKPTAAPYRLDSTDRRSADAVIINDLPLTPPPDDLHEPCDPWQPDAPAEACAGSNLKHPSSSSSSSWGSQDSDVCGFCRKPMLLSEPAIDALNRSYHAACFQCRQCHTPLAAKLYYNKSGIPLCEDCYQASLEPCWACGDVIKDHVIRALERAYHPPCFVCTTCRQPIGEQRFAQGEVGEVYCLQDYYRKYSPQCSACGQMIIPRVDGTDSYTVECLGHSYHEDCYRCQVCKVLLSPEPNENGCYPLEGQILCKRCHFTLIYNAQH
ncbi:filamin-binding LIM protein 1 isoform X1 [Triplophysa rosa]|uniref:filamin-binding LIM protein 1 isoform X1 n=1 Tax=Triplophysa rosa TaxID=992332 RepID=UPI0025462F37|nr:filamin-binding LIM protein 1 isoform X1 [Triplophysa rosa]